MGGKMSREKGKRGERDVVKLLQPIVDEVYHGHAHKPPDLKRNTLQSDRGGSDIAGLPWLSLECKNQEGQHINTWWQQTLQQARKDQEPVLIYKRNRVEFQVRMFGLVGYPSCGHTAAITVSLQDFLLWFRHRLVLELQTKGLQHD